MWHLIVEPGTADEDAKIVVYDEDGQMLACSNSSDFLVPWLLDQGQTVISMRDASGLVLVKLDRWADAGLAWPVPANTNHPPG